VVVWTFFEGNDPENLQEYRRWVAGGRKPPEPPTRWSFARSAGMALRLWRAGPAELAETLSARFRTTSGEEIPVWFFGPPRSDLDEAFFTSFAEVMTEAHAETLEMHARLVFAFVPRKFRVYRDALEIPPGSLLRDWPIGDLPERMRDLVASVSPEIGFVDLTPALSAAAARGEMVFFPDDSHWTVAGNRVVADVLAEVVRAPGGAAP
jgi:hypothetical protein